MASGSLLTLLDDIATVLDDVAVLTKVAAKKTAGVLGDDLALNAQQVSGVRADREIPVVWEVAKGSFLNKLILVPTALLLSAFLPFLIEPLLILGGLYLCFEGAEKIWHKLAHSADEQAHKEALTQALLKPEADLREFERDKIKGAIRTDFILSAEIIVIALGSASSAPISTQAMVISVIALAMTIGVYGLVAGIVKLDDFGLYLKRSSSALKQKVGAALLAFCPWLMKGLSVLGTAAMFLVGGGIIVHGVPHIHHFVEGLGGAGAVKDVLALVANFVVGLASGAVCVALLHLYQNVRGSSEEVA